MSKVNKTGQDGPFYKLDKRRQKAVMLLFEDELTDEEIAKSVQRSRSTLSSWKNEELFNMISHIVGGAVGVAGLVLCIIVSALHHNGFGLAGSIVFGVSMILLYTMSSVYHGLKPGLGKRVMQVFDHCTIYVLIAGTYTPLLLSALRPIDPVASWVLMGIVWALAAVGIAFTAIDLNKYKVFSMVCYMAIGWCIVFKLPLLIQAIGWGGFLLILGGGLLYTVGAVLYGKGKTKPFMHCVFHVFVILGSVCHILAILLFAL